MTEGKTVLRCPFRDGGRRSIHWRFAVLAMDWAAMGGGSPRGPGKRVEISNASDAQASMLQGQRAATHADGGRP